MKNKIVVQIIACQDDEIIVSPVERQNTCQRCQEGQGCGGNVWFRGFFAAKTFRLPRNNTCWQTGEMAELLLSSTAANTIAMLIYGLPLFGFLLALLLSQSYSEGVQILAAGLSLFFGIGISHFYQPILLVRCVRLEKTAANPLLYRQ